MGCWPPSSEGLTHPFADGHGFLGHGLRISHVVLHDGLEEFVLVLPFEGRLWDRGQGGGRGLLPEAPWLPHPQGLLPGAHRRPHSGAEGNGSADEGKPRPCKSERFRCTNVVSSRHLLLKRAHTRGSGRAVLTNRLRVAYLPSQHFIEQDPERPPIHRLPIGLISDDLENRGIPSGRRAAP